MMNQDIEKVLISEEQIQEKVLELGAIIAEDYKNTVPLAIGVLKGAMPFMADLLREQIHILKWILWLYLVTVTLLFQQAK